MTHLAEVCVSLGDRQRAAILYDLLQPYEGRCVVSGPGTACWGSTSRYLGQLSACMGRWDDAVRHLDHALRINTRMGSLPLIARTQFDYAAMLVARSSVGDRELARTMLDRSLGVARSLGMARLVERGGALSSALADVMAVSAEPLVVAPGGPPNESKAADHVFRCEGEYWTVSYDGTVARLKDAAGLRYIAQLLHPRMAE
jgi:tetratricopeptide (TPR) repeat protein